MEIITKAYLAIADLFLWTKVQTDDTLTIADIPLLLKYRYQYILDNWASIKNQIEGRAETYIDLDRLQVELALFDEFMKIEKYKASGSQTKQNKLISLYFTVFDNMYIEDIPTSQAEQKAIQSEISRVSTFTKNDFIVMRKLLVDGRDALADTIGGTDSDYNRIYNRSPLTPLLNKTIAQIATTNQFQVSINSIDSILANENMLKSTASIDPFAFARLNANNPEIDIKTFVSGNLVKLNYGESLQTLAGRTMGDESRWKEIAIANGLKPPYIDEIGHKIKLLTNAKGNAINLAKINDDGSINKERFHLDQIVILRSDVERSQDQRAIISIREVPISGELVIELNGEPDLEKYTTTDNAYLTVYERHTINSNFYISIPSEEAVDGPLKEAEPWYLMSKGVDEKKAGVDLNINADGDISFTSFGDVQLSYGMDNAVQAVKILLGTEAGNLPKHIDFGITYPIGGKNQNIDQIKSELATNLSEQILKDARFSRLDFLKVESISSGNQSGYMVSLGIVLAGGDIVVPLSFKVNAF
jgi:hypothetical protein